MKNNGDGKIKIGVIINNFLKLPPGMCAVKYFGKFMPVQFQGIFLELLLLVTQQSLF